MSDMEPAVMLYSYCHTITIFQVHSKRATSVFQFGFKRLAAQGVSVSSTVEAEGEINPVFIYENVCRKAF